MEVINLPLLPSDTKLKDTVDTMKWHQKAAVVRQDAAKYSLIRAVDIYSGLAHSFSVLRAVRSKFSMHEITSQEINRLGLDFSDPFRTGAKFEQLLDQVNKKYAVLDFNFGIIRVVTRHESFANQ
jgi:hypothetical protein